MEAIHLAAHHLGRGHLYRQHAMPLGIRGAHGVGHLGREQALQPAQQGEGERRRQLTEPPETVVLWVELEAVHSKAVQRIDWHALRDSSRWRQGWV